MTTQIKPAEVEALVALARRPEALKAIEDQHAREVADRKARVERIKALDAQAAIDWPRGQAAIAKAIEAREKAIRALHDADAELTSANANSFNKSHAYTRARQSEEAALLDRADLATIEAWKSELLNELTALGRPGVIVTSQTVTRSEVTRKEIKNGYSNIGTIRARMAAVRKSYEDGDLLKLEPDSRRLPAIIAEIRASWPKVDNNPGAAKA